MGAATAEVLEYANPVEERNAALLRHMPLVRFVAQRIASSFSLPAGVEHADLVSWGSIGLLEAWDRFDPDRGVKFETFAALRIRGAIVDEIRHHDWVPRNVRTRARWRNETEATLATTLGRAPSRSEVSDVLGVDGREAPAVLIPLESAAVRGGDGSDMLTIADLLADTGEQPGDAIGADETRRELATAMERLQERDRLILALYYFEGVPLGDVATLLGVTESRVSQLHRRALQALRAQLAD